MLFQDPESGDILFPMTTPYLPSPLSPEQHALLRRTITARLSDDEHQIFVHTCQRTGLDPFARHIYPAKREQWNPETRRKEASFSPEATIDGLRLTAERTGKYAGQLGPEWCGHDGQWHDIWTDDEPPVGARVGIIRSDFQQPVWGKALYSEFVQLQHGEPTEFWVKMAANQLAKCAEALGFRKAFPQQFSGIYTRDEMQQSESSGTAVAQSSETTAPGAFHDASRDNPVHAGDSPQQASRPVPVALREFVNRGTGDRKNLAAAMKFLEDELIAAAGMQGSRTFQQITIRLPRTFPTREACSAATINCWLDLWDEVLKARKAREGVAA